MQNYTVKVLDSLDTLTYLEKMQKFYQNYEVLDPDNDLPGYLDFMATCPLMYSNRDQKLSALAMSCCVQNALRVNDRNISMPTAVGSYTYNNMLANLVTWNLHGYLLNNNYCYRWVENPQWLNISTLIHMLINFSRYGYKHFEKKSNFAMFTGLFLIVSERISDIRRCLSSSVRVSLFERVMNDTEFDKKSVPLWLLAAYLGALREEGDKVNSESAKELLGSLNLPIALTRIKLFFSGFFKEAFSAWLSDLPVNSSKEKRLSIWSRIKKFFVNLLGCKNVFKDNRPCPTHMNSVLRHDNGKPVYGGGCPQTVTTPVVTP